MRYVKVMCVFNTVSERYTYVLQTLCKSLVHVRFGELSTLTPARPKCSFLNVHSRASLLHVLRMYDACITFATCFFLGGLVPNQVWTVLTLN